MDYKFSTVIFKPQEFKNDSIINDKDESKKDVKPNTLGKDEVVSICQRVVDDIQEN